MSKPSAMILALPPFPILIALLFGSGCSALICEIVWLQMLEQVIGSWGPA